ncbi:MAG: biopolymer transporter ExbD [Candidatus Caenarcaniphilales bacterium]|nr:biopolymer transporter ExbD [Candidatus Caenarcaniphilales bacterium]
MALSGGGKGRQTFNEINITPLTDVFLVLLVIMFLIAPLLDNKAALKVDPPAAESAKSTDVSKLKSILIEVTKDGTIAIDGQVVAEADVPVEQVQSKVYETLKKTADSITGGANPQAAAPEGEVASAGAEKPLVKLKADNKVDYGRVVAVLDAINKAQLGKLSLVTTVPAGQVGQ